MNRYIAKWGLYYPTVLAKGELVPYYLAKSRRFQWMRPEEVEQYQLEKFREVLSFSIKKSPFYRELYRAAGLSSGLDVRNLADVALLPSVDKRTLIDHGESINVPGFWMAGMKVTGGSTGQPVRIRKNANALARERAVTHRSYEWAGVDIGAMQARFWGVPHSKNGRAKAAIADIAANRLRFSAFNLCNKTLMSYYEAMCASSVEYIYGYVSAILMLSEFVLESGLEPISSVKAVITTSELLTESARERIGKAFQVGVFNEYGCGEVGSVAHECEYGQLHVMAENLLVEVDGKSEKNCGEIIVTDFFNLATPLIRYRLGDFATLEDGGCPCGRGLPIISAVHGRAYDLLATPIGKYIHPEAVIYVFETFQGKSRAIRQFQVVQQRVDQIEVRLVPGDEWRPEFEREIVEGVRSALGYSASVLFNYVDEIRREPSGKMRLVKSEVRS